MVNALCLVFFYIVNRDAAGQEQYRSMTAIYYRGAMVIYGVHNYYYYYSMFKIMFYCMSSNFMMYTVHLVKVLELFYYCTAQNI